LSVNVKDEAERTLLGAILLDNRLIYECAELRAEWFALDAHRQIFSAMQRLDAAGKQIDTITGIGVGRQVRVGRRLRGSQRPP